MGTYCPPCQDEFPLMNGFAARYAADGLVVVAVDVKEDEALSPRSPRSSTRLPDGPRCGRRRRRSLERNALPVHFWIDADGIVRPARSAASGPT